MTATLEAGELSGVGEGGGGHGEKKKKGNTEGFSR